MIRFTGDGEFVPASMRRFRKKPVVVMATRIEVNFEVVTLEGIMKGNPRDWLIQGIKGELYPCANDIFIETYEEVV